MEILHLIFFIIIGGTAIIAALGTVFARRIVYSLISLIVLFFTVGGIFFLLNADFAGVVQLMVYGIGVTILMIFAIMFTSDNLDKKLWIAFSPRTLVALVALGVFFICTVFGFTGEFKDFTGDHTFKTQPAQAITIQEISKNGTSKLLGESLLTKYVAPFELLSVLLLIAIVGAGVIASKDKESEEIQ